MTGEKRLLKAVVSILLILVVLSSALFIAAEVGHDCIGESCAVCRQISAVEDVLRAFGFAVIAALVARIVFNVLNRNTLCRISNLRTSTLVSLMVKLSD
mgnify:CR=1 FL=1